MLSPSRPGRKMCSDEDSSGCDTGSEVSSEPQTDRFGFIVSNGSEAWTVGPRPQLVRQREAKWINVMDQWESILLKKNNMVKVQCQKGIPSSLRAKCWPRLCGAVTRINNSKHLFQSLDSKVAPQQWVAVIERDLDRQFPFHEMFLSKEGHGQQGLFRVLKAYTQYKPEEGYCQAQGPVAAVLLMNMPAEEAFWCLVQISELYLPGYYSPLLEGVLFDATMLTWVLKRACPPAYKHLQQHGVEPLMFATDWLMCLFTRHLPFNTLLRVWDLFFCNGVRVLLQVAVVLVRRVLGRAEQRKRCQGQMETLQRLRDVRCEVQEVEDDFIAEVCAIPLSASDLERHTEKELAKWRKDRPSSTFDPRGRCQGYRMAWARAQDNQEDLEKKERETGNLSVPLTRSASSLSLSSSRWRKGGNVWERVPRHLSKDWRSCNELSFKDTGGINPQRGMAKREMTQTEAMKNVEKMQKRKTDLEQDNSKEAAKSSQSPTVTHRPDDRSSSQKDKYHRTESSEDTAGGPRLQRKEQGDALAQTQEDKAGEHANIMQQQLAADMQSSAKICHTNTVVEHVHQGGGAQSTSKKKQANEEINLNQACKATGSLARKEKSGYSSCNRSLSGDVCIRKSSRLTRRLSKDLFTDPRQAPANSPNPTVPHTEPAKHFSLFRRQPKNVVGTGIQVPTILIQDFSDELVEEEERRRRRRWWQPQEQERRDKEEEKKEKEGERRKPQTRGKSFQVQRETMKSSFSYAESYF
ncbi:TBC1 domain family member 10B isoform X2 [Dunckerocampus dactyliophorus]|uniref:TBC1 domain family member 10B isoform X2 n=1 Tax=Dunckerocampus dactyliophorus TaxID=161453 RepID=UPI002405C0CE|nr:TBC1 domain family member 10B isoform X2 [Dunckerocampus dactyliophorus]